MDEYLQVSNRLRHESAQAGDPRHVELALGTFTGESPWSSAVAGLALGALVGLPLMLVTLVRAAASTWSAEQAGSIAALGLIIVHAARWAVFGLVYGYFYPRLRGRSAFPKAAWFTAAMLPVELVVAWLSNNGTADLSALGIATIQLCAFAAVLALAWETRQARRAGVGWGGIRDLRSLRTLAAPVGAVVLAAVTAAATTFASTEVPTWVAPQQSAVSPQPSSSPGAGTQGP